MWNIIGNPWMCWHFIAESLVTERKVERCFAPPHCLPWLRNANTLPTKKWSNHSTPTTMFSTSAIPSSSISTPPSPDISQRTLIDTFETPFISFQNSYLLYSLVLNMVSIISLHIFILWLRVYLFQSNISWCGVFKKINLNTNLDYKPFSNLFFLI